MLSSLEKNLFRNGYRAIAGIDEVGRGPLAGPVTAAIVAIRKEVKIKGVRDSKLLSAKQREEIFERVKDHPDITWRVSHVYPKVIDRINIWQATLLAWKRSLKKLDCPPVFLFLDGNRPIPRLKMEQSPIVGGDRRIFLLSLASVIAKVSRDRLMKRMDWKYPQYGFGRHKGYGTKYHLAALKKYGPSEIHRKSFRPVFNNLALKDRIYILNQRNGIKVDLLRKEGYF